MPARWCLTPLGQQIVDENRGIAGKVAKRFAWSGVSSADRRSAAYVGLCNAVATFTPRLGFAFSTYAYYCCKRQVWEEYGRDHVIRQPRHVLEDRVSENLREQARRTQHVELYPPHILADRVLDPHEIEVTDADPRAAQIARLMERYLTTRERSIIQSHLAGRTLVAIGLEWGISKERVRQIEASAYRRIRTMMGVGVS
jgi:RNA polymerase sigma factor (sigma-70 family)